MRNEPLAGLDAESSDPRNNPLGPDSGSNGTSPAASGTTGDASILPARLMQELRDRGRNVGRLESVAAECLRLGTLAAGLHRHARVASATPALAGIGVAEGIGSTAESDRESLSEDHA